MPISTFVLSLGQFFGKHFCVTEKWNVIGIEGSGNEGCEAEHVTIPWKAVITKDMRNSRLRVLNSGFRPFLVRSFHSVFCFFWAGDGTEIVIHHSSIVLH